MEWEETEKEFIKLEEEMEKKGLIPESGDANRYWPAMVLRVSRLLYERENNGMVNYHMEDEDGFYHKFEEELNQFGSKYGLGLLGTMIVYGGEEGLSEAVSNFIKVVREHKEEWEVGAWEPTY